MTLRDDLEAAVRQLSGNPTEALTDDAWTTALPIGEGRVLPAQARIDLTGQYVMLLTPLARLVDGGRDTVLTLLTRNADPSLTDAASYAVVVDDEGPALVAVHHWALPRLSADQFGELLIVFARAVRGMVEDLAELAAGGAPLELVEGESLA